MHKDAPENAVCEDCIRMTKGIENVVEDPDGRMFLLSRDEEILGFISYHEPWNEYTATFKNNAYISADFSEYITNKLKKLNKK